jgi:hypothetical protein
MEMNRLPVEYGTPDNRGTIDFITLYLNLPPWDPSKVCDDASEIVFHPPHQGVGCVTELCGVLGNDIHHGLEISRRSSDYAQDFAGRCLPFERLVALTP